MTIVGVSLDTECERAASLVERFELSWPQVCDGAGLEGEIARRYDVRETPAYFVIASDGALAGSAASADRLEPMIRSALPADVRP